MEEGGCASWSTWRKGKRRAFTWTSATIARRSPGWPCGRRVLDAFCYTGGFGLHAARAGASAVVGVDASEPALALARRKRPAERPGQPGVRARGRVRSSRCPVAARESGLAWWCSTRPSLPGPAEPSKRPCAAIGGCRRWRCGCWSRTAFWSPAVAPALSLGYAG